MEPMEEWSPRVWAPDGSPLQIEEISFPKPKQARISFVPKMVGVYIFEATENISGTLMARAVFDINEVTIQKWESKMENFLKSPPLRGPNDDPSNPLNYLSIQICDAPVADFENDPNEVSFIIQIHSVDPVLMPKVTIDEYDINVTIVGPNAAVVSYDTVVEGGEMRVAFLPGSPGVYAVSLSCMNRPLCAFQTVVTSPPSAAQSLPSPSSMVTSSCSPNPASVNPRVHSSQKGIVRIPFVFF